MNKYLPFILKKGKPILQNYSNNSALNLLNNTSQISKNSVFKNQFSYLESEKKNESSTKVGQTIEEEFLSSSKVPDSEFNSGRWSDDEHIKFINGMLEYGNEWKLVQKVIKTRSSTQARSHAQKFFLKIKNSIKKKNLIKDSEGIIKYIFNSEKKINEGIPLNELQKKRLIDVIISNIKKKDKDIFNFTEIQNKMNSSIKNEDEHSFSDNSNENQKNNKIFILNKEYKAIKYIPNNADLSTGKRETIFCGKKRKGSYDDNKIRKIFEIIKVNKYKSNNDMNKNKISDKYKSLIPIQNNAINIKCNKNLKNENNNENCNENISSQNIVTPFLGGKYIINNNIINITNNFNNNLFINKNIINNHINNAIHIFDFINNNDLTIIDGNNIDYIDTFDRFNNYTEALNDNDENKEKKIAIWKMNFLLNLIFLKIK